VVLIGLSANVQARATVMTYSRRDGLTFSL
jgi:hypothetical protein